MVNHFILQYERRLLIYWASFLFFYVFTHGIVNENSVLCFLFTYVVASPLTVTSAIWLGVASSSYIILSQDTCLNQSSKQVATVYSFVCMNAQISAVTKARDTKFDISISVNYAQVELISNIVCHAQRLHNSRIYFFKSICKQHNKDTTFWLLPILSWLKYLPLLQI